jgi:hypothetical protein
MHVKAFQVASDLQSFLPNLIIHLSVRPFHLTLIYHRYNMRLGVEVMKLLSVKFSAASYCLLPSIHNMFPYHPVLKHPTFASNGRKQKL